MRADFDWTPRTRLVFGAGALAGLGALARELSGRRALLVTDPGLVRAGHAARAGDALKAAGVAVAVFDAVRENPTDEDVDACVAAARASDADLLIGLGGGSSIDTAKGANLLVTNGGRLVDYWKAGNPEARSPARPLLPLIAVPTTAGTGSEMQSYALLGDPATHAKRAIGDPRATPLLALLDPELTRSCPRAVAAVTGIDALSHAIESAVTTRANPLSTLFSREAFALLWANFKPALERPEDLSAHGAMLRGAAYAGLAIENSMLGAAHALANPLTARFGIVHGQAVGMMLPQVVRFNAAEPGARAAYETWMPADALAAGLEELLEAAGLARRLCAFGVGEDDLPALAAEAAQQWTARFNPRPATIEEMIALYRAAW